MARGSVASTAVRAAAVRRTITAAIAPIAPIVATVVRTITAAIAPIIAPIAPIVVAVAVVAPIAAIVVATTVVAATTAVIVATTPAAAAAAATAAGFWLAAFEAGRLGAKDAGATRRAIPVSGAYIALTLGARDNDLGTDLAALVLPLVVLLGCVRCILWGAVGEEGEALVFPHITHGELHVLKVAVPAEVGAQVVFVCLVREASQEELAPLAICVGTGPHDSPRAPG